MSDQFSFGFAATSRTISERSIAKTIVKMDISAVDRELTHFVPQKALSQLAGQGLRGELLFAVPVLLQKNPNLLGYYRLMLGFRKKEFYSGKFGLTTFKTMEEKGIFSANNQAQLVPLCLTLIKGAVQLLNKIGIERLTFELQGNLQQTTLYPQIMSWFNGKWKLVARKLRWKSIEIIFKIAP